MAETKSENLEREYTIPLRREWSKVARYKRAKKAGKAVKEFLVRHMKVYDKDLNKIKLDKYVNEELWFRGIKKPPARIKVKVKKDSNGIVRVELFELPEKLKFKKAKEEKREKKAEEIKTKHVHAPEEHKHEEAKPEETEEKKEEAEEKKATTIEGMEKLEKEMSKKVKHQKGGKQKEPKHQFRKALQK